MPTQPLIYWFRQDLRLTDSAALSAAAQTGREIIPCYILDDKSPGQWRMGNASRWWLRHSLAALAEGIAALGGNLVIRKGETEKELPALAHKHNARAVYCSRCYEPWAAELENKLHKSLGTENVELLSFPGDLLFEPEQVITRSGTPFQVFTPFWKHCLSLPSPQKPPPQKKPLKFARIRENTKNALKNLDPPTKTGRMSQWRTLWQPGEEGAQNHLLRFLERGITDYAEGRNHPARDCVSRLSPHLRFGEISPRKLFHTLLNQRNNRPELKEHTDKFLSQLGWREFSRHLLCRFPHLPEKPFKKNFEKFPWRENSGLFEAWKRGQTGYPVVDAGMRELWETGYMHNRVRMITASFLTKHLLIPWQSGEKWFWDTLVDADLANNSFGWQWVAGCGADAAPYFRIFNPALQGGKFDEDGAYVRRRIPEIAALEDKYLSEPLSAPAGALKAAGIEPGATYPAPVVDHRKARTAALAAYDAVKSRP
ncbi:MAG: deoxyribodipyrimidine photo-lyase [Candidatus Dadabacteria bacterium]|nr:deoxyribodipyrimidine photo-lyase [Candidatus Dadabacteria bacterium]